MRLGRVLGLRGRITATVLLCVLVSTAAVSIAAYVLQERNSRNRFEVAAIAETDSDALQAGREINRGEVDPAQAVVDFLRGRSGVEWVVLAGGRQYLSDGLSGPLDSAQLLDATDQRSSDVRVDGVDRLAVPDQVAGGVSLVELYNLEPLQAELSDLRRNVVRIGLIALACTGVLGALIAERVHRPVQRARAAALRLGTGDLTARVPVRGRDELAQLGEAFNTMAGELESMTSRQRQFVADVSHELRTPLASLVAAADSVDSPDPAVRERVAELLRTQTRRLATLVEDLLEISRFDAGAAVLDREPVDVGALARDVAAGTVATVEVVGDVTLAADPRRLHTVLRNVVSNALRYGRPPVTVLVTGGPASVTVTIADHGDGVPAELAALVFDRFVRGDPARRASDGSGLGLAIARENALLHGGALTLVPSDTGAVFELRLPRA